MRSKKSADGIVLICCNMLGRPELIKQEAVTYFLLIWSYRERVLKKKTATDETVRSEIKLWKQVEWQVSNSDE